MDLHPLIVHFPIALLTVYSVLEIVRRVAPRLRPVLKTTQCILLFLGYIGGRMALRSGEEMAEPRAEDSVSHDLLEAHETFANASMLIYGILFAVMLIGVVAYRIKPYLPSERQIGVEVIVRFIVRLDRRHIRQLLAIAGMGSLMITGAL